MPPTEAEIDMKRQSAISLSVESIDDDSPITDMLSVADELYVIKERGIYLLRLADEIDPHRHNPDLPNVIQKIAHVGSDSEVLGRSLLTAMSLLKRAYIEKEFDNDDALRICLHFALDAAALAEIATAFEASVRNAIDRVEDRRKEDGSLLMPSIADVQVKVHSFIHRIDHALRSLLEIIWMFYPNTAGKGYGAFRVCISKCYGDHDPFVQFMHEACEFIKPIREMRNCMEHPQKDRLLRIRNFVMTSASDVIYPTIELIHPATPIAAISITQFMREVVNTTLDIFESTIAYLSSKHLKTHGGLAFMIVDCLWKVDVIRTFVTQ
jgi:hypothetical protein